MECRMNRKRKEISEGNQRKLTKRANSKKIESVKYPSSLYSSNTQLPVDLVVVVLARLPAATLQRFRCVCKSWDSLIREDRHLASLHLDCSRRRRHGTKQPALVSLSRFRRPLDDLDRLNPLRYPFSDTLSHYLEDDPTVRTLDLRGLFLGDEGFNITNSYNGLVGIYDDDSFFILNPSIRKIEKLPRSSPHDRVVNQMPAAGLGFDASTGDYKVVRLFHRGFGPPVIVGCEVISLGGNETSSWRLIDDPSGEVSYDCLPVSVNGAIYWQLQQSWKTGLIGLYFDPSREKFGIVAHPEGILLDWSMHSYITELGGCFCVAVTKSYSMSLWLMKDPGNSKWVKQYEIELRNIYKHIGVIGTSLKPLTLHNGKIVFHDRKGRRVYYDPRTGQSSQQDRIAKIHSEYVSPYTESIVWPW